MAKNGNMPLILGAAAAAVALGASRSTSAKPRKRSKGSSNPVWPLVNNFEAKVPTPGEYWTARAIGASRSATKLHSGIDLKAKWGDVCVATEDGVIVKTQGWDGDQAKAILLQSNSGPVLLYGAVAPNSWKEFNVGRGVKVKKGQPIARVGMYPGGSTMLHFEMYRKGTTKNYRWMKGDPPPKALLDPTNYLKRASKNKIG